MGRIAGDDGRGTFSMLDNYCNRDTGQDAFYAPVSGSFTGFVVIAPLCSVDGKALMVHGMHPAWLEPSQYWFEENGNP